MTRTTELHSSVRQIRRRLFGLLMQAFGMMVVLTTVLLIGLFSLFIRNYAPGDPRFRPPLADALEAYYLARGSWDGVEAVPAQLSAERRWGDEASGAIVLDEAGRVVIDRGRTDTPRVGQVYALDEHDWQFPLRAGNRTVGMVVFERSGGFGPWLIFRGLLPAVGIISFFTGLLTLLIGLLLARRVVTPLADVIAGAQSVAAGDLSTRVAVRGPGDLRSLSESFNQMAAALERDDRERRNLLADIAHELRTPLTVIRGRLEGIVDGIYPTDDAHVAPVLEETYILERLVEDLRLLALLEAHQVQFDRKPVDLGELAERAAGLFEAEAAEKGTQLAVRVEPGLPPVQADPQRMEQVIGNLVSNAVRYTPENGRVTIAVQRADGGVEVAVSDNGPGVPAAELPKIFDRFWRGEKSRTRAAGGAGLGLAIARQLVEAQGGRIEAANGAEGGLRVAVWVSGVQVSGAQVSGVK